MTARVYVAYPPYEMVEISGSASGVATVAQWAGQVAYLRPGGMIGLATAQPQGPKRTQRGANPGPRTQTLRAQPCAAGQPSQAGIL